MRTEMYLFLSLGRLSDDSFLLNLLEKLHIQYISAYTIITSKLLQLLQKGRFYISDPLSKYKSKHDYS